MQFIKNTYKSYNCSTTEMNIITDVSECKKCDNSDYKRVIGFYGRCQRCDAFEISDHKDNIVNTCNKCDRGVDWVTRTDNLSDDYYLCASGKDDVGYKNDYFTTIITTR